MTDDNGQENASTGTDLAEGYPSLSDVLRRMLDDPEIPERGVRRVEVNCFASGDATYNVWTVDLEEPRGGYWDNS